MQHEEIVGLMTAARATDETVVLHRRHLHRHPELRWREEQTLNYIHAVVEHAGFGKAGDMFMQTFDGGLVVDLTFDPGFDRILLRADVDALPITEATGLPFASQYRGVMHACGHDAHSAMLLGAFHAIVSGKVKPAHNLRFVWERAEEQPGTAPNPKSGAEALIEKGVLQDIAAAYGLHIWAGPIPGTSGTFYSRPGPLLGNSGRIKFEIHAPGGHVARPYTGVNVLHITAMIQQQLSTFLARHLDPLQPATLEPTVLNAGTATNVLAQDATLWYAVRTMLPRAAHLQLLQAIKDEVEHVVGLFPGAQLKAVDMIGGHPVLINRAASHRDVSSVLEKAGQRVDSHDPILGGESFAHYLDPEHGVPGCFWMLSAHVSGGGEHHADNFMVDESVFWQGVLYWLLLACE